MLKGKKIFPKLLFNINFMAKTKIIKPKKLEKLAPFMFFFSQIHGTFWDTSL